MILMIHRIRFFNMKALITIKKENRKPVTPNCFLFTAQGGFTRDPFDSCKLPATVERRESEKYLKTSSQCEMIGKRGERHG